MPSFAPGQVFAVLARGEVAWTTDDLRWTLHTGAVPDQDVVQYVDDLGASELPTGNGYTAGGQAATGVTVAAYDPGTNATALDADDPSWEPASGETLTARYAVLSSRTPALAADQPVLYVVDFGEDTSATGAPFTVLLDADGILVGTVAAAA